MRLAANRIGWAERNGAGSVGAASLIGHLFEFRGRRGDLGNLLSWDGDSLYLFSRGYNVERWWLQSESGSVLLTREQTEAVGKNRPKASCTQLETRDGCLIR
jgi:hypothetical protein